MPVDPIFNRCFEPIFGFPCWEVKRGYGSFLTLEFGEPHLQIQEPMNSESGSSKVVELLPRRNVTVCGQWHLWIQGCDWSVYEGEQKMGSSDDDDSMDAAARYLDGQKMTSMTITLAANSRFQFDLGGTLSTVPYDDTGEQWALYQPNGNVLTLRANGTYSCSPGSLSPKEEIWNSVWID